MRQILDFKSKFPEDLYVPAWNSSDDYIQRVFFGFEEMSKKTVTIGLLARNIENIVEYTILRVKKLRDMFLRSNIIWLENGSTDKTREKIAFSCFNQHYMSDTNKEILLSHKKLDDNSDDNLVRINKLDNLPFQVDKSSDRCNRMAICRNILRDNMLRHDTDYYILIDADLLGGYSYEGIANSFSYTWDVCASNSLIYIEGKRYYYDSWAWRDLNHPECYTDEDINTRKYERGEQLIEVMSAFGGLAIYKNTYFTNKKYRYNDTDCDHPTIHIPMHKDGAKIVVNPSQITLYNKSRYVL